MKQQQGQSGQSDRSQDNLSLKNKDSWYMRWFLLIAFILILCFVLWLIAISKNVLLLPFATLLVLTMRPIIRYLFPSERPKDSPL